EQARLAMIDETHHRYDGRTGLTLAILWLGRVRALGHRDGLAFADRHVFDRPTEFLTDHLRGVRIQRTLDVHPTGPQRHQLHQHFTGLDPHFGCQSLE